MMEYLKGKPIAVLGGGNVAKAIAGDCALGGAKVRICDVEPFAERSLRGVENGGIRFYGEQMNLYGFQREGVARMELVTTDVAEAVRGAGIIVVGTTVFGHKPFFEKMIPHLEDGQVVMIFPDNFGSLLLYKMLKEAGCTKKVIVGGWSSSTYGSRIDMAGKLPTNRVKVYYRAITLRGAAMPHKDTPAFIEASKYLPSFDAVTFGDGPVAAETALDTALSNVNPVLHCPGTILGVSTMENYGRIFGDDRLKYSIYSHAYCESISEVQYSFYQEECALAKAMGVDIQQYDKEDFFSRENVLGQEYMGKDYKIPFTDQDPIQYGTGPFSMENRYITEDIPIGCNVYSQLGRQYGVKTPIIDCMITLAEAMLKRDLVSTGYTLKDLNLEGLSVEELNRYLREGSV